MGSFAATEGARREAVRRPLGLIEDLLAVCSAPNSAAGAAIKRASSAIQGEEGQRGTSAGGKATPSVEEAYRGGGRDQPGKGGYSDEVAVLRAYALEAGVGLFCLLPADDQGGMAEREEILERLLRWHER